MMRWRRLFLVLLTARCGGIGLSCQTAVVLITHGEECQVSPTPPRPQPSPRGLIFALDGAESDELSPGDGWRTTRPYAPQS